MQVFYSTPLGSHTLPVLPMMVPGNLALPKSHQTPLPMINSLLDGIVFLKTTSLPAQAPSDVCQRTGLRSSCWSGLPYVEALGPLPSCTACLPTSCSPVTHQPSQSQQEQGRSSPDLSLRFSAPRVTDKSLMMGSPCDGKWGAEPDVPGIAGGGGPAELLC